MHGFPDGRMIDVGGGLRLHCVEMGAGPLVVLLHGFPEFWYSWKHQMPALAAAGLRVVAPDLRGYNLSDKPAGVRAYLGENMAADIAGLIGALGAEKAHVVGHDWGGAIAWLFAMRHADKLDRLAILNMPHVDRFLRSLRTWKQLKKSWYIFYFQLPWLPERMIRAKDFRGIRWLLRHDPVRKDAFTPEDVERYVEALRQPGALTAAIHYYRALSRRSPWATRRQFRPIERPTLMIFGERDRFLGLELAQPDPESVKDFRLVRIPDASHWVHWDAPGQVNRLLVDFFQP